MRRNVLILLCAALLGGCIEGRTSLSPNQDRLLRKKPQQFAADARTRQYPTTAPHTAVAPMRAEVDYQLKLINLVNLGDQEWDDVELWVNGRYVCFVPRIEVKVEKTINFQILFDNEGKSFPTSLAIEPVKKVEIYAGGNVYEVPLYLAD